MSRRRFLLPLFLLVGCSHFHTGRSFLSEMENDDSTFYRPEEDFPVVAGDTGRSWISDQERRARTPASEHDLQEDRASRSLKNELKELEGQQLEEDLELYDKHKHQLGTVSEKIYFLKLPAGERLDYLLTRGFIEQEKTPYYTDEEKMFALRKQDILLGMSKADVIQSWGKPLQVDYAGNPRNENERWLYKANGASKFIYFEAGEVQGWE